MQILQTNTRQTRAWATIARDGRVRVVLINDSPTSSSTVTVHAQSGGTAALERLLAPSATATSGITLGGQTFGTQTTTGALPGPITAESVPPSGSAGSPPSYTVALPRASAAVLTIPPPPRAPALR